MRYLITPVPKPRMTKKGIYNKGKMKPGIAKYFAFKDECFYRGVTLPESGAHVVFYVPMPKSWTLKKRTLMNGQPHQQRPDADNMMKALMDAVYKEDGMVWDFRVTKLWAVEGAIEVLSFP